MSALRKSAGTVGSGSSFANAMSRNTLAPTTLRAASRNLPLTLSQWLFCPSGFSVARMGKPLMVPSIVVRPREGSLALAAFGNVRKLHEPPFAGEAGCRSFALNRIRPAFRGILHDIARTVPGQCANPMRASASPSRTMPIVRNRDSCNRSKSATAFTPERPKPVKLAAAATAWLLHT